jgi:DNA repair exonuclease SbcCD nuclease subunit
VRLLLFSDLHLDTQFAWLAGRPKLAGQRRQALRETLVRIADLAVSERVDALMCGGDLYEHDRFTPDTAAFVRSVFARLDPLSVYLAPGNHDWLGPASLYEQVEWSPNVRIFRDDRLTPLTLLDGLTLWGAAHQAPANTDGFLDEFRVDRGGIHIALFHGSEQGALAFQEQGKAPHAPFRVNQIPESGLQHALLGHFHRSRATDYFTYPGNPDPLTFGEDGERGAVLVTVNEDGGVTQEWRTVAASALHAISVDVTGCGSQQDVRAAIQEATTGLVGCAQLTLFGELDPAIELHVSQLGGTHSDDLEVLVRAGELHHAYDVEAISRESTVRGQFTRDVLASSDMDAETRQLVLVTGLRALDGRSDLDATA